MTGASSGTGEATARHRAATGAFGARRSDRIDGLAQELTTAGHKVLAVKTDVTDCAQDQMIDVNLKDTLYGVAAALPYMKEQKSGHIINMASVYDHVVGPGVSVYCATKFAVRALSEGIRQDVKSYNVRTTILSPGAMKTELFDHISDETIQAGTKEFVGAVGMTAADFGEVVAFAISQPAHDDINEILFRPTAQPR